VSFNRLCNHPDLGISRDKLINMVKVAAQERFLRYSEADLTGLHYSHRLKLTALPNDEFKLDMALECVTENLTTPQLRYRVRRRLAEIEAAGGSETAEGEGPASASDPAVAAFTASLARLNEMAASLTPEMLAGRMADLGPETRDVIVNQLTTLSDTLDATQLMLEQLLRQLLDTESDH
jgi:hypothetical protein